METTLNPLAPPFTKGDALMFEPWLIHSPSYKGEASMLETGLIHPLLKKRGMGDLPGHTRCSMEFLHS